MQYTEQSVDRPLPSAARPTLPKSAKRSTPSKAVNGARARRRSKEDGFLQHYFRQIDPRVADSFTDEQRHAIVAMFGARGITRHPIDIRRSLPFGRGRAYFVLLMGRERRSVERLDREGLMSGSLDLVAYLLLALGLLLPLFALAYLVKS